MKILYQTKATKNFKILTLYNEFNDVFQIKFKKKSKTFGLEQFEQLINYLNK